VPHIFGNKTFLQIPLLEWFQGYVSSPIPHDVMKTNNSLYPAWQCLQSQNWLQQSVYHPLSHPPTWLSADTYCLAWICLILLHFMSNLRKSNMVLHCSLLDDFSRNARSGSLYFSMYLKLAIMFKSCNKENI
jgi:hypothetical protein